MNAPRQGLYATLLAISYALHTTLIVEGTAHQLATTRDAQGQLLIRQLAEDATLGVARQDTVSLALLANRYSQRAGVVSMRILAADGHVLATGGNAPSRDGQLFQQILLQDRTQNGQVELTLAEASLGEVVRLQWLPLLLSLLIHIFLWLLYRVVARPKRSAQEEISNETLSDASPTQAAALNIPTKNAPEPILQIKTADAETQTAYPVVLRIAYSDPRGLLDTLTPSTSEKYFSLCQKILEEAIRVLGNNMPNEGTPTKISIVESFGANGALVGINQNSAPALGHLLLLAQLLNLLSDAVYRRNRVEKRFALHTCAAITEVDTADESTPNSTQQSAELIQHANASDVLIHVSDTNLSRLMIQFSLSALEKPVESLGEVMRLSGLRSDQAQLIERAREQILGRSTA
ncbi:hypothetical protein [Aquirhabdus parva]|uniref:Uncharacterized protein n=1 Tax=Aquirhabdus parva TaxID=2283318 RepID=A0A345P2K7_9GAMM|nr:hypothetical protein [Aquirhabdus parva]AXI01516.1 hypothetical protein HYN46_00535 [Aquirhabdus parva]